MDQVGVPEPILSRIPEAGDRTFQPSTNTAEKKLAGAGGTGKMDGKPVASLSHPPPVAVAFVDVHTNAAALVNQLPHQKRQRK